MKTILFRQTRRKTRSGCDGTTTVSVFWTHSSMPPRPMHLLMLQNFARLRRRIYQPGHSRNSMAAVSDAALHLRQALKLAPNNARALYYRALVERNQGDLDGAIADLRLVAQAFPRSRDAHRELGFSLYQQHKYQAACDEYKIVQTIDPDDLAAHYILAILYRRLGVKDKAAEQAAIFADQKDDPVPTSMPSITFEHTSRLPTRASHGTPTSSTPRRTTSPVRSPRPSVPPRISYVGLAHAINKKEPIVELPLTSTHA